MFKALKPDRSGGLGGVAAQVYYRNCATSEVCATEPVKYFLARNLPDQDTQVSLVGGAPSSRGSSRGGGVDMSVVVLTALEKARLACAAATLLQVLVTDNVPNQVALASCDGIRRLVGLGTTVEPFMQVNYSQIVNYS